MYGPYISSLIRIDYTTKIQYTIIDTNQDLFETVKLYSTFFVYFEKIWKEQMGGISSKRKTRRRWIVYDSPLKKTKV